MERAVKKATNNEKSFVKGIDIYHDERKTAHNPLLLISSPPFDFLWPHKFSSLFLQYFTEVFVEQYAQDLNNLRQIVSGIFRPEWYIVFKAANFLV